MTRSPLPALLGLIAVVGAASSASAQNVQFYNHAEVTVGGTNDIRFSPNGRYVAAGTDGGRVIVIDTEAGREVRQIRGIRGDVVGLGFSPDGLSIWAAGDNRYIGEFDLLSGDALQEARTSEDIRSMDVSPDGRFIAWSGEDGTVELLTNRLRPQQVFESSNLYDKETQFVAFGIEGTEVMVAAEEGRTAFWGVGSEDPIRQNELVREEFISAGRDSSGELLAFGIKAISLTQRAGQPMRARASHKVQLFDWERGRIAREIEDLPDEVLAVAVSPDQSVVAVGFADGTIEAYSTEETRRISGIYDGSEARALRFSPDGRWLAAGLDNNRLMLWEVAGLGQSRVATAQQTGGQRTTTGGDIFSREEKFEFQTSSDPLITSFDYFTMAVLDVDNLGVPAEVADAVSNLVVSRLANVPFIELVERAEIERVTGELALQNTGVTSAQDAAEIGRLLNAQNVLLGNVNQFGTSTVISLRVVEVESARVLGSREVLCRECALEDLPRTITVLMSSVVEMR